MDFYYAKYRTEKFSFGEWRQEVFIEPLYTGKYIVIAENLEEATQKINTCLKKESNNKYRQILTSDICRCDGLDIMDDGSHLYNATKIIH